MRKLREDEAGGIGGIGGIGGSIQLPLSQLKSVEEGRRKQEEGSRKKQSGRLCGVRGGRGA